MLLCVRSFLLAVVTIIALVVGFAVPIQSAVAAPIDDITPPIPSEPIVSEPSVEPIGEFTLEEPPAAPIIGRVAARRGPDPEAAEPIVEPDNSDAIAKTEYTSTFRNDDGSKTTQVGLEPINVRVDGQWKDVSTKVLYDLDEGWGVEAHPLEPRFAGKADEPEAFSITSDDHTISMTLRGSAASALDRRSSGDPGEAFDEVLYRDVLHDVDLTYNVDRGGVKETLVLKSRPARGENRWVWDIDAPGLTMANGQAGSIILKDADGEVVVTIPNLVMWDSSGREGVREPALQNLSTSFAKFGDTWRLTATASAKWLADPRREYPVYVDPTLWSSGPSNFMGYKSDGVTSNSFVRVGNTRQYNTNVYWRTVIHYPYGALIGKQILSAGIYGEYEDGTTNGYTGGLYTANCWGYSCAGGYLQPLGTAGGGWLTDASNPALASAIAYWTSQGAPAGTLFMTGDEGSSYSYKGLTTGLYINWQDFPSVTGVVAPSPVGGARGGVTPTFKATSTNPSGYGNEYRYLVSANPDPAVDTVYTSPWSLTAERQVPTGQLAPGTTYYWKACVRDAAFPNHLGISSERCGSVNSWVANAPAPTPVQESAVPADGSVVTGLTPTLTTAASTDPNGDPVKYQFVIASGSDGLSGAVTQSGWLDSPTWTVPVGSLQPGGVYYWMVQTDDGYDKLSGWVNTIRVDLRLGASGPSPFDTVGPVTVNLANGNANLSFASPTVNTVGGPMGMAFTYNSLIPANQFRGLTGSYYSVTSSPAVFDLAGKTPVLVRTDEALSFDWADGSPGPSVPSDNFMARWTGFVKVPSAGSYTFGVVRENGAKLLVGGTTVIDAWAASGSLTAVTWGTAKSMTTTPAPLQFDYYDVSGQAKLQLWVRTPAGNEFIVPSDWFTTKLETLPAGWSSSTAIAGSGGAYALARVTESSVTLTDATGGTHVYVKKSTGGYATPVGEYGIMSLDGVGQVVLTEDDGTVYTFNAQGEIATVTTPGDAQKPATPIVTYRPGTGQVDRISDSLSLVPGSNPAAYSRELRFIYSGDSGVSTGLTGADVSSNDPCLVPVGFSAAPSGMLCRIIYPNHAAGALDTTRVLYDANGYLSRIVDPGDEQTSFTFGGGGRLMYVDDSLAMDWYNSPSTRPSGVNYSAFQARTHITYDPQGRVEQVRLPAPDGLSYGLRGFKTYLWGAGTTAVATWDVGGANPSVTYDSAMRQLTATSSLGLMFSKEWSSKDQLLSVTDPWGVKSTTIYDSQDRATESFGPAPVACFGADRRPAPSCGFTPAHSTTAFDRGLQGLHAAYYTNQSMTGAPKSFALGIGTADGSIAQDWTTTSPIAQIGADNWSLRLTGLITYPTAGTYQFRSIADDGTALWIDDVRIFDDWSTAGAHTSISAPGSPVIGGQRDRIRLHYRDDTGAAKLELQWKTPGSSTWVTVPGSALAPDYGLANGSTTEDAAPAGSGLSDAQAPDLVTALSYQHPWLGAVTGSTVDPSGLALTTETTYEAPGTAWLRRLDKRMPAAVAQDQGAATAGATFTYWGDTERPSVGYCSTGSVPQSGLLKSSTAPTPAAGSPVVTEYVYDWFGRVAGTKRSGDADWTCQSYDSRGRPFMTQFAAFGGAAARLTRNNYALSGNPLVRTVQDGSVAGSPNGSTLTTKTDVLGRLISYTDVWNTVTTITYFKYLSRVKSIDTRAATGTSSVQAFTYDTDGKVESVSLDGVVVADPTYAANSLAQSVSYVNGSALGSIESDATGATAARTFTFPTLSQQSTVSHPRASGYSTDFESGMDGWTGSLAARSYSGARAVSADPVVGSGSMTSRALTNLTPGRKYTFKAWLSTPEDSGAGVRAVISVAGIGSSPTYSPPSTTWSAAVFTFVATAATHTIQIEASSSSSGSAGLFVDDPSILQDAWVEQVTTTTPQASITDSVLRSQSGRILQNVLTDGTTTETSTYSYDSAGRLVSATIPRHTLSYAFAQSGGCGANPAAGRNGNRTSFSDSKDGATATTVAYCYDDADRLTSFTGTSAITYDGHGNTLVIGDQTLTYDVADRHMSTTLTDGTVITYVRDATGRIVARTDDPAGAPPATTIRYLFAAGGLFGVANGSGALLERSLSLPGGVSVSISATAQTWSYPNLHGDVIVTADAAGKRQGARASYDPFGQPIDPVTGDIGTAAANDAVPDTSPGEADYAWVGGAKKLYEHQGSIATIEMGVRQYVPSLGRFLSCDPVEGGVTNSYDYPADPINKVDLTGEAARSIGDWAKPPVKASRGQSVLSVASQMKSGAWNKVGSGGYIPGPPDCNGGACRQADVALSVCVLACLGLRYAHREDGKDLLGFALALGPRFEASVSAGSSTNSSTGWSFGGSCEAAAGFGYYVGASPSVDPGLGTIGPTYQGTSTSSGSLIGAGVGCSLDAVFLQEAPWASWH